MFQLHIWYLFINKDLPTRIQWTVQLSKWTESILKLEKCDKPAIPKILENSGYISLYYLRLQMGAVKNEHDAHDNCITWTIGRKFATWNLCIMVHALLSWNQPIRMVCMSLDSMVPFGLDTIQRNTGKVQKCDKM